MDDTNYKAIILDLATRLTAAAEDAAKFDRGQDAAGMRLRALFLTLSKELKEYRSTIQDLRNKRKNSTQKD
jgi:hypothetical protein